MKKYLIILTIIINSINFFSKEAIIKIIDSDINIPLEGVKIHENKSKEIKYTDKEGKAKISVNDNDDYLILSLELIGYQTKKIRLTKFNQEQIIKMNIENIIEGKELVIEEKKIKNNEELGVSKIIDKNRLKSTSMSGIVQDVMSTIKTMPGVSYGGGRGNNNLSIRGGDTDGFTTLLDGFIVRYPYQWSGMYSIFAPNIVESVKFSAGVFSAKNGLATSAIMEVNSITPDEGFKITSMISLADSELYIQTPLWKNSGLLLGGRFIYYDLVNLMMGGITRGMGMNLNSNNQYLRDGYFKWFWKPTERLEWYINGFFGSDGITMNSDRRRNTEGISSKFKMNYYNYDTFWNTGFKILPNDKVFIHFFTGYEFLTNGYNGSSGYEGEQEYSDKFKKYYNNLRRMNPSLPDISNKDSLKIDIDSWMKSETILHSLQTRFDLDITLHEKAMLSVGGGGIYDYNTSNASGKTWQFVRDDDGELVYKKRKFESDTEDKSILKTFLYFNFNFNIIPETLKIETGCRIDHNLLFGPDYYLNTYPVPGPRFNITFTPVKNLTYLESLSFSMGTGLFSKPPDMSGITGSMGLRDFDVSVPKTLTTVLGMELKFPIGLTFKVEGYYKYVFNRFYINTDNSDSKIKYLKHTDGIGHTAGFDLTLEKYFSRWVDGALTYSFIYARLLNPSTDDSDGNENIGGEPTGTWYYPSYHKFHNFNIFLNIKPTGWCTITPKFSFSSGAPKSETSTEQSYALMENDLVAEMYTSTSEYNDSLRDDFNIQFDLKLSFSSFFPKTKLKWEVFLSVENLFVFLYSPSRGGRIDQFTGEDETSSGANYNSQTPIPNLGFKLEF